jgi:hypothetical protein
MRRSTWVKQGSSLGTISYFRKYIQGLSRRADKLFNLLKKDVPYIFDDARRAQFHDLRTALSNPPILAMFNTSFDYILHTDVSSKGLGACLLQSDPAKPKDLHTIAYISRSLLPSKKNYAICD